MDIIPTVADEVFPADGVGSGFFFAPKPGVVGFGAGWFGAAIFVFERERNGTEQASASFADVICQQEGSDVLADTVVDVGMPALGLVFKWFPADEDVQWGLTFANAVA